MIDDSDFKIKAQSFSRKVEKLIVICTKKSWYTMIFIGWSNETDSKDHGRRKRIDKNSRQNSLNLRKSKLAIK